jgi:hypothetical protein
MPTHCTVVLFNYSIDTTSMALSAALLSEREVIDTMFQEKILALEWLKAHEDRVVFCDSTGTSVGCGSAYQTIDLLDLIDAVASAKIYETLELGCCRTYSHHKLKTRCLACVGLVFGDRNQVNEIIHRLKQDFEK